MARNTKKETGKDVQHEAGAYEGHDTELATRQFRKGHYSAVGTSVPTQDRTYSPNQKTGKVFGDTSEGQ
jgi:hypothetical protein